MDYQIQHFFKHGPVVVIVWKNTEGFPIDYVTENVAELIGYTADELTKEYFDYNTLIHPEDLQRISEDVANNVKAGIEYYEHEPYRVKHKSGHYIWVLDFTTVFRNEQHEVIYYQGYLIKYTAEQEAKMQLMEQGEMFKHQQEKLKLILSAARAGTWEWNMQTNDLQVDDGWANMLGYQQEEILPQVDSWAKLVHPDDYPQVENIYKEHVQGISSFYTATYRMKTKSGEWKWILDSGKVIKQDEKGNPLLFIGTHMDVDESKRNELEVVRNKNEAIKSSRRYKGLFNAISDAVFVIPFERDLHSFLEINESATQKYGYDYSELCKFTFDDLTRNTATKTYTKLNIYAELLNNGSFEFEDVHFTKGGEAFDVYVKLKVFEWEEERSIICVVRDITQEKRNSEQLKQMNAELQLARNKAEESDRLKSAFLANMSHEIRTPLNAIVGFSGFLREPGRTPEQLLRYGNIIESSGKHLLHLINDIIDLSKIDSGQIELLTSEVDVHLIMQSLFHSFKEQIRMSGKKIELIMSKAQWELQILSDETRINQIFLNLLNNALKFTTTGYIEFGYSLEQNQVVLFVKDSGIGISPDKLDIVFDRFRQADETIEKQYGGTGLGLPIVKANAHLLGGKVWLESEPNKGTTVFVSLPYNKFEFQEKAANGKTNYLQFDQQLILVAEDEIMNFNFLYELLTDHNLRVVHAKSGKETLDLVLNTDGIRLVLLDIKMPEINGWELIKLLKAQRPDMVVIAQTAYGLESEIKKGLDLGFDDYITKPIDYQKLLQVIHSHLYR